MDHEGECEEANRAQPGRRAKRHRAGGSFGVERAAVESLAFRLLTGAAPRVYLLFLSKRSFCKQDKRAVLRGKGDKWVELNVGQIVFPYAQAKKLGISAGQFRRALDQLIGAGFLDVTHPGGGMQGDASLYGISERWRCFGTPAFQQARRPACLGIGFQRQRQRA